MSEPDPDLVLMQEEHRREQVAKMDAGLPWHISGPASPLWIACLWCGADVGSKCSGRPGRGYCIRRETDNARRMDDGG